MKTVFKIKVLYVVFLNRNQVKNRFLSKTKISNLHKRFFNKFQSTWRKKAHKNSISNASKILANCHKQKTVYINDCNILFYLLFSHLFYVSAFYYFHFFILFCVNICIQSLRSFALSLSLFLVEPRLDMKKCFIMAYDRVTPQLLKTQFFLPSCLYFCRFVRFFTRSMFVI